MNVGHASQGLRLGASIEAPIRLVLESPQLPDLIPAGTRVYLPDLGTDPDELVVKAARRLTDLGRVAVPHVAVRRCASGERLHRRLAALTQEAGVRDLLLIGGDRDSPAGPFAQTMDVLEEGGIDRYGLTDLAVAGHPEGRSLLTAPAEFELLRLKQAFAERTDLRMRIVTQFGFCPDTFTRWAAALAGEEIGLPVHLGIAGPAKLATLIKFAVTCGVGNSLSFLRKRGGALSALMGSYAPDDMVQPIEDHLRVQPATPIEQLHVYAFGGLEKTAEWLRARGSWQ